MIEVDLSEAGETGFRLLATLRVNDDKTYEISGPGRDRVPLGMPMQDVRCRDIVRFEDDPHRWAQLLPQTYRSPYLVATLRQDDQDQDDVEVTRKEAAQLAGIQADTWSSYVSRGLAPAPLRHTGSTPLWSKTAVHEWLGSRRRKTAAAK